VACSQSYVALAVVVVRGLTALSFEGVFLGTDDMQGLRLRQKQNERPQLQGLQLIITVQSSLQESNLDLGLCKGNYDNCSINHRKVCHGSAQQKRKLPNHLRIALQVSVGATLL